MKKKWIAVFGSGILIVSIAVAGVSLANSEGSAVRAGTIRIEKHTKADFPTMAKIDMVQAVRKALASVRGRLLKTEIDDENGFLVYGVEVVTPDKVIMNVKVDAGNGKILAMYKEKGDDGENESGDQGDQDR